MSNGQEQESQELIPSVQDTILFNGKPLVVVRLSEMPTLVLNSIPYWLATINTRRMEKDDPRRLEILHYQKEAVAALYDWASSHKVVAAPANLVSSTPITEPTRPAPDASLDEWLEYHQQMVMVLEWRGDVEQWRGGVESRLEGLEAII